ncbi:unnamed protein product [Pedinophyceae sp. YPF-701]|nr:unnamed protein product [Pedinophyceae sp. YPF-701]
MRLAASRQGGAALPAALRHIASMPSLANFKVEFPQGGDEPPMTGMMVHGLLGSGKNWRSTSKKLAEALHKSTGRKWQFVVPDLRNHGLSAPIPGFNAPHNVEAAAYDVIRTWEQCFDGSAPFVVCGHSLGGKVVMQALQHARDEGRPMPKQVWMLDSFPGTVSADREGTDVVQFMTMVSAIEVPVPSRSGVIDMITEKGWNVEVAKWVASSLVKMRSTDKGLTWAFSVPGAAAMYDSYRRTRQWDILHTPPPSTEVHVLRGARSDRWDAHGIEKLETVFDANRMLDRSEAGLMYVHCLEGAGHWVHTDNQAGLLEVLTQHIARAATDTRDQIDPNLAELGQMQRIM